MDSKTLKKTYQGYEENVEKWAKVETVYEGNKKGLYENGFAVVRANEDGTEDVKFKERKKNASPVPLLATIVEAYLWRLRSATKQINVEWGPILESRRDRILSDVNGRGDGLWTVWMEGLMWDILFNQSYSIVDGPSAYPTVHNIHPRSVLDYGNGWIKIKDTVTVRPSYNGSNKPWEMDDEYLNRYNVYTTDQLYRYTIKNEGMENEEVEVEEIGYNKKKNGWQHLDRNGDPILPVSTSMVPTKRDVMNSLSDVNLNIFNKKAFRDYVLLVTCTPKAQFVGSPEEYKKMKNELSNGNIWTVDPRHQGSGHKFFSPSMEGPSHLTDVLDQDVGQFMMMAQRWIEDSIKTGAQKSATQVKQEAAQGENTFLYSVLNAGVEKLTNWFIRLENHYDPSYSKNHGQFSIDISDVDFKPINAQKIADRYIERYGKLNLPVGEQGYIDYVKSVAESDDLNYDERELEESAREKYNRNREQNAFGAAFGEGQI